MPARTNEFQRLVFLVQNQIQNGRVRESVLVEDRFGTGSREVDVWVEVNAGGVPLHIAFECTSDARKADKTWIDAMVGKHANLPTDKLILVSRNGFARSAARYAAKHRAEAVTFEEAETVQWGEYAKQLHSLVFGLFSFNGVPRELSYQKLSAADPDLALDLVPDRCTNTIDGTSGTWSALLSAILRDSHGARALMSKWFESAERPLKFVQSATVTFRDGHIRITSRGVDYLATKLTLDVHVTVDPRPIELKLSTFMGTAVASHRIELDSTHADIAVTCRPGAPPIFSVAMGDVVSSGPLEIRESGTARDADAGAFTAEKTQIQ